MGLIAAIEWPGVAGMIAFADLFAVVLTILWVLTIKREPTSAIAWCLLVFFVPVAGIFLFITFGYQSIHRPLKRKKRHARGYRTKPVHTLSPPATDTEGLAALAERLGAMPMTGGNQVQFFHEPADAYVAMLDAIKQAKHHIHMEFFITRGDASGRRFMTALAERAAAGVRVRFLYDAVGSWNFKHKVREILTNAGGRAVSFLPLSNPLRRRLQINLRNHRKILVIDGQVGFTGGLNIGDEYLGLVARFGLWRDTFLRIDGPAVAGLQRVFGEDWDFAANEEFDGPEYFPVIQPAGAEAVQIAWSGPDQDTKAVREVYFAAIMRARKRVWISTPYFVPDAPLADALALAARSGRDVRIVVPFRPDKWVPLMASRFIWQTLLEAGVKIFQFTAGFMHAKMMIVDDAWASVGSVNFDNRSLHLNFEVTALMESTALVAELEAAFRRDMARSIEVNAETFQRRPFVSKMAENAARLASPIL
ncbi:cardiolipin synthase [Zavarzinella formosa]|uniref:cardiolipin synthase n=1 Tax=Zavarzinella formosa TaxID=360055 RepID=UPI000311E58D|nr:cardiolipin synthase [Zavarzinella formosa]